MSADGAALKKTENANRGNQNIPCPLYGCKRVYKDMGTLESHIKDHELPAQSLPGKVLLCSTIGCSGSFPNMQKLMEHIRHHHKPNIFFLCENCRTKLRSYRGLLTHLHTCSKVSRGKTKPDPATVSNPNMTPTAMDLNPSQLETVSSQQQLPSQTSNPDASFPTAVPQADSAGPPLLGPSCLFNPEASSLQLTEAAHPQPQLDRPTAAPSAPDTETQHQPQARTPEPIPPAPASPPHSPPASAAVWKKNQGLACNRRILWEHTKGRYTCVQCGFIATNRKDMTQHINNQHNNNKPAEDTGSPVTNT
ncbi:hypothetical protein PAMA_000067 [Pampus argenteus]